MCLVVSGSASLCVSCGYTVSDPSTILLMASGLFGTESAPFGTDEDAVIPKLGNVARYVLSDAGDLRQPPQLVGKGELLLAPGYLKHTFSGKDVKRSSKTAKDWWVFLFTPDTQIRWAHSTQWPTNYVVYNALQGAPLGGLGLIIYDTLTKERFLLVFEDEPIDTTSAFARSIEKAITESALEVSEPHPDPPRWAASCAGGMLRSSLRKRNDWILWGACKGTDMEAKALEKRMEQLPTEDPKKVNPVAKKSVEVVGGATGWFADAIEGIAGAIGGALIGAGKGIAKNSKPAMRPVLDTPGGLATTTICGSTFHSGGAIVTGVIGAAAHIATSHGKASVEDSRHKHGDDFADMTGKSILATHNVVRSTVLITSHGTGALIGNAAMGATIGAAGEVTMTKVCDLRRLRAWQIRQI